MRRFHNKAEILVIRHEVDFCRFAIQLVECCRLYEELLLTFVDLLCRLSMLVGKLQAALPLILC
jgi:hypothetical protein